MAAAMSRGASASSKRGSVGHERYSLGSCTLSCIARDACPAKLESLRPTRLTPGPGGMSPK